MPGDGPSAGEPLGSHQDVDMVSFTGSMETSRLFQRYVAHGIFLKKVVLECGGNNSAIVLEDAEELDLFAGKINNAAFWNMGENCSANSRLRATNNLVSAVKTMALTLTINTPSSCAASSRVDPPLRHPSYASSNFYLDLFFLPETPSSFLLTFIKFTSRNLIPSWRSAWER